jgi:NADH:ubiquinone oxidoreductase subunit H
MTDSDSGPFRPWIFVALALGVASSMTLLYVLLAAAFLGGWRADVQTNRFGEGIPELAFFAFSAVYLLYGFVRYMADDTRRIRSARRGLN